MHTKICKQGNKVHFACNCKPDPRCNLRYKLLPETPFLHSNKLDTGQHVVIYVDVIVKAPQLTFGLNSERVSLCVMYSLTPENIFIG